MIWHPILSTKQYPTNVIVMAAISTWKLKTTSQYTRVPLHSPCNVCTYNSIAAQIWIICNLALWDRRKTLLLSLPDTKGNWLEQEI